MESLDDAVVFCDHLTVLLKGDCLSLIRKLDLSKFACVVSDPPYGMNYKSGWNANSTVVNDNSTAVRDKMLSLVDGMPALVFGRWSVARPAKTKFLLIWDKGDWPGMGDLSMPWGPSTEEIYVIGKGFRKTEKRRSQVIRHNRLVGKMNHPTEKPVPLMEELIKTCPPGVILDPFAGSGSTLVAARRLGVKAVGIEMREDYCEIIKKRLTEEDLETRSSLV